MNALFLVAATVLGFAGDVYDVTMTEKGLKAGVAVEGNSFLVGEKPSSTALYIRDSALLALCTVPSLLAIKFHSAPFFYAGLVSPLVYGVKHVLGGLAWKKLLKK